MLLGCRLRELLDSDKCQYTSESSAATQETALERQSRLRERARQLREKREQERLAYVEEKYEQQFRWVIPRLHDEANIKQIWSMYKAYMRSNHQVNIKQPSSKNRANVKQTSSKHQAVRAHVVQVYFEYICFMVAWYLLDVCLIV